MWPVARRSRTVLAYSNLARLVPFGLGHKYYSSNSNGELLADILQEQIANRAWWTIQSARSALSIGIKRPSTLHR